METIKCDCGREAISKDGLKFNGYTVKGWACPNCGIIGYDPKQTERILSLNKLKQKEFNLKLSQIRSNLILRFPKEVSNILGLEKGDRVRFRLKDINNVVISVEDSSVQKKLLGI
ncbi:hypothetical protein D6777_03735 [Candidatus Woesearchaeota archaeon]|nr:MAG: hypothetical protein D6777_03735 [Candidatus Woesearchaeota archaeon]